MGVKLSFDKLLPGYSRSRYLTDFRNRTLWNGPVDEWLEEVAGGILSPLLTGEHEQWRENLSGENLWTTFLTTSLMGAGFSALELPNVAAYVHKTHVLQTEEKKALAKIENEELRKQVFEAMHKPTMSQQAQAMAAIDWQAANIGKMDAAHAADYARFRLQRQILDGMETGDAEGEALHTAVQTAERWAYKGLDGKTATEEIITENLCRTFGRHRRSGYGRNLIRPRPRNRPARTDRPDGTRTYRTNAAGGIFSTAGSNHRTAGRS